MFNMLDVTVELNRLRQDEMRRMADNLRQQPRGNRSPVLAALGRQLVILGEKLQHTARMPEQADFELQTNQA